ncbi:MAG: BspA family leucine-rich repeat surface protein [Erysipelotrichaceae bacterium]|nr:BspA family leucine-rich repeat surface protein [Erysipelotrichaceae bacterium]
MPFAPLCCGYAGVVRAIRVVPTEDCSKLILPENCSYLFQDFSNVTEIDTGSFDTGRAVNMNSMFADCSSLSCLNLYNFDLLAVRAITDMFANCPSLKTVIGSPLPLPN